MKSLRVVLLAGLILLYGIFFLIQDKKGMKREVVLQPSMPVSFYTIATGYLRQLAAEILFIRASVFVGGVPPGTPETTFEQALGNNLDTMTRLYPRFLDPYYFCQGVLPHISPEAALQTSTVLETGISAYPEDQFLHFFYASNFFLAMNEPLKGAEAFVEAAKLPEAPPMFGHLAALLSARGGDIAAGLISLRAMLAGEKDKAVRKRYQEEIHHHQQVKAELTQQEKATARIVDNYREEYSLSKRSLLDVLDAERARFNTGFQRISVRAAYRFAEYRMLAVQSKLVDYFGAKPAVSVTKPNFEQRVSDRPLEVFNVTIDPLQ